MVWATTWNLSDVPLPPSGMSVRSGEPSIAIRVHVPNSAPPTHGPLGLTLSEDLVFFKSVHHRVIQGEALRDPPVITRMN